MNYTLVIRAVNKGCNLLWLSILDEPLIMLLNLDIVNRIHS